MTSHAQRSPAERERGDFCNSPAGVSDSAHNPEFTSCGAPSLQRQSHASPEIAGRALIPPVGRAALSKDPSGQNVRRFLRCWQPSRAPTHGLFLTKGCVDRARNFFVSRPKPGSYPTDDGTKFLHAPQSAWSNARCLVPG